MNFHFRERNTIDLQVEICYNSAVEVVFIAQLKGCLKEIKGCGLRYGVHMADMLGNALGVDMTIQTFLIWIAIFVKK